MDEANIKIVRRELLKIRDLIDIVAAQAKLGAERNTILKIRSSLELIADQYIVNVDPGVELERIPSGVFGEKKRRKRRSKKKKSKKRSKKGK